MDQTAVLITAISAAAALLLVVGTVFLLRKRVTRVERRGGKLTVDAAAPATREFESKRTEVTDHSSIEPLKDTSMKVDKAKVSDNSTIRVRDTGEPFADGTGGK